jgi:hypothetical protein
MEGSPARGGVSLLPFGVTMLGPDALGGTRRAERDGGGCEPKPRARVFQDTRDAGCMTPRNCAAGFSRP